MDRKRLGALLVAFVAGLVLSAGSALAHIETLSGYLMGDPAPGKLVPFYRVGPSLATLIGIESTEHGAGSDAGPLESFEGDLTVHVAVFNKRSSEILNFTLCLSPFDFGFVVLQQGAITAAQSEELFGPLGRHTKAKIVSAASDLIPTEGYVTLAVVHEFLSNNGTCVGVEDESPDFEDHLATWALLADIGTGFFATEVPTPSAVVNPVTGGVVGLVLSPDGEVIRSSTGLIPGPTPLGPGTFFPDGFGTFNGTPGHPLLYAATNPIWGGNAVIARFDVNPAVDSHTEIFVWLKRNAFPVATELDVTTLQRVPAVPAFWDCEDETELSFTLPLPDEVNVIDPDTLPGLGECKELEEFRGVVRFALPDTGFLWSQITQETAHFRETFLGYNLDNNGFVDCADSFDDFGDSAEGLCPGPVL